jgi:large subunit ribosomal protein L31
MKEGIHPTYYPDAVVTCACGNTWTTGSTTKEIHTDVCSNCHPFFTGEQRIVDTEGQVDRFYKKLQARQDYIDEVDAREAEKVSPERPISELAEKVSPERPISELELGTRATDALARADIIKVGQVMEMMETGEASLLAVEGFGRKSLADLKKRLRQFGYKLPEAVEEIQV